MKSFLFSVVHPTLARPDLAIARCEEWLSKSERPEDVEYVFGLHSFDTPENRQRLFAFAEQQKSRVVVSCTPRRGSASNWNQAAAATYGSVILQAQDDLAPPTGWDRLLRERLEQGAGSDWAKQPVFVAVSDGHRKDRLCITTILTKVYRDQRGFFLYPGYDGVYADDDSTAQAYNDAAAGRVVLIEARDLVFEHQHFSHSGGMAFDETYALENSSAAYKAGEALFATRHPRWHLEQLCRKAPPTQSPIIIVEQPAAAPSSAASAPKVSIVIPCYAQAEYLPEAIESVLAQTFLDWELVIVNDGSPDRCSEIARNAILRNPQRCIRLLEKQNSGVADARNEGIRASRGSYVLPLDADDKLDPQMLEKTVDVLERQPEVAIAYTDWMYFGAESGTRMAAEYDRERLCFKENLFTCTALFRKEAWKAVNGFNRNMVYGVEDWDFWVGCVEKGYFGQRVPQTLFFYRAKSTGRNKQAQSHLREMYARIVLNHPALYPVEVIKQASLLLNATSLPAPKPLVPATEWIPALAAENEFASIISAADELLRAGRIDEATAQIVAALDKAPTAEARVRAREILDMLRSIRPATPAPAAVREPADSFFPAEEAENLEKLIADYVANPTVPDLREQVYALQQSFMQFLVTADVSHLPGHLKGSFGKVFRLLAASGLRSESPTPESDAQLATLDDAIVSMAGNRHFDVRPLLARMLLAPAHRGEHKFHLRPIPAWLLSDYLEYIFSAPKLFVTRGEVDLYHRHVSAWSAVMEKQIKRSPEDPKTRAVASAAVKASYIPLYCSPHNTRDIAVSRAAIMEFVVRGNGSVTEVLQRPRPARGRRIRVGFVCAHFGAQTETHVTLPLLQLDRSKFEILLFAVANNPGPVEDYCRTFADRFSILPEQLSLQVTALRQAQLDVAIIGTNMTAVTNHIALLACHRFAPYQVATYCSPVTTGMRHIDGFLTGTLAQYPGIEAEFSEQIWCCEGAPGCLDYTVESRGQSGRCDRASVGLGEEDVVFVNAAACFKILPEMCETWAKIIRAVPRSRLFLMAFNPNWSRTFPVHQFENTLRTAFAREGLSEDRFVLAPSLPSRADVKAMERLADVYLDTFPFSGSISIVDALEVGLPTVVWEGNLHRSRMSAALLRELKMTDLIVTGEREYVDLAVKLGVDSAVRRHVRSRLTEQMARKPTFINPAAYAQRFGALLEEIVAGDQATSRTTAAA